MRDPATTADARASAPLGRGTAYPAAGFGEVVGGWAIDGVDGRAGFVAIGGFVAGGSFVADAGVIVALVVVGLVDVVVGDAGVVATSDDVDVVDLAALVVVARVDTVVVSVVVPAAAEVVSTGAAGVVPAGVVGVEVGRGVVGTVVVGTVVVTGLGSAVTVTVDVSTGVGGVVDIGGGTTGPGSGTLGMIWIERLAVAEKLAPADAAVEVDGGASVVVAVIDSGAAAVVDSVVAAGPAPGSVGSTAGGAAPESAAVSVLSDPSPGTEISLAASGVVLWFTAPISLETAPQPVCTAARPEYACASFTPIGGLESARTTSVIPIAVLTNAVTTPAREIRRWYRSPHHRIRCRDSRSISATRFSLSSTVPIPTTTFFVRMCRPPETGDHTAFPHRKHARDRTSNSGSAARPAYRAPAFRLRRRDPRRAAVAGEFSAVHPRG
ncbi:hypothetical protein [Nocardia africana]|uniref:Uncharacterized protein n=1 Tax=Nocardia africana TaxID=134964 RepID=A0ABW6NEF0_9NOCA